MKVFPIIMAVALAVSCRNARLVELGPASCPENQEAIAIWQENMKVIENLLSGQETVMSQYYKAADFLQGLTGISPEDELHYVGRMPSNNLHAAYEGWQKWYWGNKHRLWYDSAKGQVVLLEPYANTP